MTILRNKSHGEIMRVCIGIFTIALRNKKKSQILNKNTLPYSISERPIQEAKNSSSKWPGGHKSDNLLDQSQEREERETKIVVDSLYIQ